MARHRTTIEWLLNVRGALTVQELSTHANITRQSACNLLTRLVRTGELYKRGNGRGARYFPAESNPARTNAYGPRLGDFWLRLQGKVPAVIRVRLADFQVALRLRDQVFELLERTRPYEFVFLDFEHVDDASDAFLEALVMDWQKEAIWPPTIINANDQLARRIRRLQARPPRTPPDDDPLCCS